MRSKTRIYTSDWFQEYGVFIKRKLFFGVGYQEIILRDNCYLFVTQSNKIVPIVYLGTRIHLHTRHFLLNIIILISVSSVYISEFTWCSFVENQETFSSHDFSKSLFCGNKWLNSWQVYKYGEKCKSVVLWFCQRSISKFFSSRVQSAQTRPRLRFCTIIPKLYQS